MIWSFGPGHEREPEAGVRHQAGEHDRGEKPVARADQPPAPRVPEVVHERLRVLDDAAGKDRVGRRGSRSPLGEVPLAAERVDRPLQPEDLLVSVGDAGAHERRALEERLLDDLRLRDELGQRLLGPVDDREDDDVGGPPAHEEPSPSDPSSWSAACTSASDEVSDAQASGSTR